MQTDSEMNQFSRRTPAFFLSSDCYGRSLSRGART